MTRLKTAAVSAILGAALVGTLPGNALAAKQSAASAALTNMTRLLQKEASAHAIAFGTLSATGTDTATLTTPNGNSLTINLAPKARITARTQAAAAAGYKTGDQVLVIGTYRNGFLGTAVQYDTVAFPTPFVTRIEGKVSTSSAQALSLMLAGSKTAQIQLGIATRYFLNGKGMAAAPTFTTNEKVTVLAQVQTDGSELARIVAAGTLNPTVPASTVTRTAGTIASVASDNASFTFTAANGKSATVTISATTKFRVNGIAATTAPTLTANEKVVVQGTRSTDASGTVTIAATLIVVKTA